MTRPTPLNAHARDDQFDDALTRLLAGDIGAIDDIEPGLQSTVGNVTRLARDANWLNEDPGASPSSLSMWREFLAPVGRLVAACLTLIIVSSLLYGTVRVLNEDGGSSGFGSTDTDGMAVVGLGRCEREGLSQEAIQEHLTMETSARANVGVFDIDSAVPMQDMLQTVRDWNACQATGNYAQAMAYQSSWYSQQIIGPDYATGSDIEILNRQARIVPFPASDDVHLETYVISDIGSASGGGDIGFAELWIVPLDQYDDWVIWPKIVTFVWIDGNWYVDGIEEAPPTEPVASPSASPVASPKSVTPTP